MATVPLCAVDTETTGVHRKRRIWEVALIRREPDSEQAETSFFMEVDLADADGIGLGIGRFYERHPMGQWLSGRRPDRSTTYADALYPEQYAAETIARWTHGAHIIGAVPNFDTTSFEQLMWERGLLPAWHYHLIDVENLAVGYLKGQGIASSDTVNNLEPPWDSDELCKLLGVEPSSDEERHTALGDARWALRMYDAVMGGE